MPNVVLFFRLKKPGKKRTVNFIGLMNNFNSITIGIMQGRLSSIQNGRLQFFPADWEVEFTLAKEIGFETIEWFFDRKSDALNPLDDIWGNPEIVKKIKAASRIVPTTSMDTDQSLLYGDQAGKSVDRLGRLMNLSAGIIGTFNVAILEDSRVNNAYELVELKNNLHPLIKVAEGNDQRIALETEMPSAILADLIKGFDSPAIGVCYDIGNCTSFGFDCPSDIRLLSNLIFEVHAKDRKIGSSQSVYLGTGDADFETCFKALKDVGFKGNLILQTWRSDDYLADAKGQLEFVKGILRKIY